MFSTLWLEFQNLALIRGGVLNDTDTNQKYIKRGRKLSYNRISNILNEVGNIKILLKKVGNHPYRYLEFTDILRDVWISSKNWWTIYSTIY